MIEIPAAARDFLDEIVVGILATVRPDGTPQANPMWFAFDADSGTIRFTHTSKRGKYRNLQVNPGMSFVIMSPNGYRYAEFRGRLLEAIPDPTGAFYGDLSERYDGDRQTPPDAADRVVLVMSIDAVDDTRA